MQVARADAQKGEIVKQHSCQQDLHKVIEDPQKKHRIIVSTAADNKSQIEAAENENTRLTVLLAEERAKSGAHIQALEDENKALRGQVACVLGYLDEIMPREEPTPD